MPRRMKFVLLMVVIWAALFLASFYMSTRIEGPRNIDTGFRRLDVLARYQVIAFAVAVVSATIGIAWRRDARRMMLLGLVPVLVTSLLILVIVVATLVLGQRPAPDEAYPPPKPTTAPAADLIAPDQD